MNKVNITTGKQIKEIVKQIVADKKDEGGIKNIFCVACGGSLACLYPLTYFIRSESRSMHADSISANEFVFATPMNVDKNSLVLVMSLAGKTPETVAAGIVAKERGATVIALCAEPGALLEENSDYSVYYRVELDRVWEETNQTLILNIAFELLQETEGYEYYSDALDGLSKIGTICDQARVKVIPRSLEWGESMKDEPIIYTIGSGPSTFVAYMQTICMFMEMQWVNSNNIHSGEFFHGPFEITDQTNPFMIFLSEGRTRYLDERALNFLNRYAKKIEVLDAKELGINTIKDSVVEFFNPIVHWAVGLEYAEGLGKAKQHPLMMRRYLNKVEY